MLNESKSNGFKQAPQILIAVLTAISGWSAPFPSHAQTIPQAITCEVTIAVDQGARLTYRLTGNIPNAISPNQPQNLPGLTTQMTVQRRDRTGRTQTLLKATTVKDYAEIAPDADYSQLPFTEGFRGRPNNAQRLYAVSASAHGLYASLRPTNGQPQQMQIVHYLSPGKFVRSAAGRCGLNAPPQAQVPSLSPQEQAMIAKTLAPLNQQLDAQNWAAADRETRRILDPASVSLKPLPPIRVTPALIRAMDQAWSNASGGRFGLSVQLRLWQEAKAAHPNNRDAAVNAFRDRVGWTLTTPRTEQDFLSSDWRNESELNYSRQAPLGHLPWAGVSDAVVQDLAIPPVGEHCGSCHTDAMQLRNERFYGHLPTLFQQVQVALPPK
jgi:hypothetical protein